MEGKMEELARKEKLSKLAILDTIHAKKDPLSLSEETVKNKLLDMGLDYSYTQPSDSEDYGLGNTAVSGHSSTEMNILLDQAEIEATRIQYPPQPEVEFGFPKECYCGREPVIRTSVSRTDPGRRFYTCENIDDGDCHAYKWWDVVATEEIKAIGTQYALLSDKVDYIAAVSDYESELNQVKDLHHETELKLVVLEKTLAELSKKISPFGNRFEVVLGGLVLVVMVMAVFVMFK
ncbi:hypothetical protein F2Q69_00005841 [Brassica cretica]|uniref:GRF-type domain-containing protein n=1 Tax=Brassica cretica TaxID=69181 RepID=A0A8S9P3Y8_BRACR|nr:hypothetical protein F2Q69_00005841 [Brassica cretica]